jgi:threonine dehydratase
VSGSGEVPLVSGADVEAAAALLKDVVRHTPMWHSRGLADRVGGPVWLKCENLQRTGSFKIRGAYTRISRLTDAERARGVVAASAGNHAQGVALAARLLGCSATVFMPVAAPLPKVAATRAYGAEIQLVGQTLTEALAAAAEHAERTGAVFIHPFEHPDVIAGQGTVGLELLEEVDDLAAVVVPVGGGGLASGIAMAVREERPDVRVVGVRAEAVGGLTIADGIAVKHPGTITAGLLERYLDDVVVVPEDEIAEAMVLLLERAKLVVEGAGAVGVAGLLDGRVACPGQGTTVAILSGGNVDAGLLASIARRHETEAGRRLVITTRIDDHPGALARLLAIVAERGANLVEVSHVREGIDLHVRETAVELVLETRSRDHAEECLGAIEQAGYRVRVLR